MGFLPVRIDMPPKPVSGGRETGVERARMRWNSMCDGKVTGYSSLIGVLGYMRHVKWIPGDGKQNGELDVKVQRRE